MPLRKHSPSHFLLSRIQMFQPSTKRKDFRFPYRQGDTVDRDSCFPELYTSTSNNYSTGEDVNLNGSEHSVIISVTLQ